MIREMTRKAASGYVALVLLPVLTIFTGWQFLRAAKLSDPVAATAGLLLLVVLLVLFRGFFMVHPNQAKVLQLFGTHVGSVRQTGLRWANPFCTKVAVSLRVRNFESEVLKVNDGSGNPVDTAAVVVWKVVGSAEAVFEVDDCESLVHIQSEAALRNLATRYPYEASDEGQVALRSDPQAIAEKLREEVQDRLERAGVKLKRQQAAAVVAARRQIVDGAVGMVRMALTEPEAQGVVDFDQERKANMLCNVLVVLCGEENAQPVLNTGSLY